MLPKLVPLCKRILNLKKCMTVQSCYATVKYGGLSFSILEFVFFPTIKLTKNVLVLFAYLKLLQ